LKIESNIRPYREACDFDLKDWQDLKITGLQKALSILPVSSCFKSFGKHLSMLNLSIEEASSEFRTQDRLTRDVFTRFDCRVDSKEASNGLNMETGWGLRTSWVYRRPELLDCWD